MWLLPDYLLKEKKEYYLERDGHYTYELEKDNHQICVVCTLHHYHSIVCRCGHENKARPSEGVISVEEGRKQNLKLTENRLIGPILPTFIAALNRETECTGKRYGSILLVGPILKYHLAHLTRKAIALTGAVDQNARKMGDWFLREIRGLIVAMAEGENGKKKCGPILARLKKACNFGSKAGHAKLKALAKEILNVWDAVGGVCQKSTSSCDQ